MGDVCGKILAVVLDLNADKTKFSFFSRAKNMNLDNLIVTIKQGGIITLAFT